MRFIARVIAIVIVFSLGGLTLIYSGVYNVAANNHHFGLTYWVLHTAVRRSIEYHARDIQAPASFTDAQEKQGFSMYNETCVYCHGGPGKDPVDFGQGLYPEPPFLADTVRSWTNGQLFWIIKNGIKASGMPTFGGTHKDEEIWTAVAFIQKLPGMTPEQYTAMEKSPGGSEQK